MTLFGFALRNLTRRPGRSIFTLIGVALAVASYIALAGLATGMAEGTTASLKERGVDLSVSRKGIVDLFGGSLPQELEQKIAAIPGVAAVAAELVTFQELGEGAQAIVGGWRMDGFIMAETQLVSGAPPVAGAKEVLLGDTLAEALGVTTGSELEVGFDSVRVSGVANFGTGLLRGMAVMPLADLQTLLGLPGQVTVFQVRLAEGADPAPVAKAIEALRPDLNAATSDDAVRANKAVEMLAVASLAIAAIAMAMAALTVLNTLSMAVEERVREIGILGSVGWPRGRILALIVLEGLILAAIGGLIGILLGNLGAEALSVLLLPGSGLTITGTFALGLQGFAAALLIGALGAFWPALRAANLEPATALRRE